MSMTIRTAAIAGALLVIAVQAIGLFAGLAHIGTMFETDGARRLYGLIAVPCVLLTMFANIVFMMSYLERYFDREARRASFMVKVREKLARLPEI